MIKIGNSYINLETITRIVDRTVYFSDGKTEVYTEPELQDILAALFNEPRKEDDKVDSNDTMSARNRTNKPKRISK
jgi:hypothetical protein